jgi:hypothetical protein
MINVIAIGYFITDLKEYEGYKRYALICGVVLASTLAELISEKRVICSSKC